MFLVPPRPPALQESVDSQVTCLPTHFKAICSKFGEPSLRLAFVKSSANTLPGGRIPTVMVEIEPAVCLVQVAGRQVHCTSFVFFEIVEQFPLAPYFRNNQLHQVVSKNWNLWEDLLLVVASAVLREFQQWLCFLIWCISWNDGSWSTWWGHVCASFS